MKEKVVFFKPYPLQVGQKIHIESGPRKGDWLVKEVSERKVKLQCPISGFEAHWDRFCYFTEDQEAIWPDTSK